MPVQPQNYSEKMTPDCNNPKHGQINSMDRLSDLPDFIIHHIISYLGNKEAYRTSALSKRWNQIFDTNPILDFYHYKFPLEMIRRHLEYIDTRMQKFSKENLRITKFKLAIKDTDLLLACKVDGWVEIAVRNQVAEISLSGPANYKLSYILLSAKSLTSLNCHNLEIPYYEALDLVSLESLTLGRVVVEERMLLHIVSSCPLLKHLRLSGCSGFKNLAVPRCSKLEYLYFDGILPGRVILETSSLRSFQYDPDPDVDNNPWPIISNRGLLRNLRFLSVTDVSITDEALAELLPQLPLLEKLQFWFCGMLTSIKISHTQLKQICLHHCYNLLNVVIDAPCLKEFEFYGKIVPSLSITINSQANSNIHTCIMPDSFFKAGGFFELKKLLTSGLNSCNVLKIVLCILLSKSGEDDIKFAEEESGNAELGPPCDIGELKLNLAYRELSSSSLSAFLNGLFWTCHPDIISLRVKPEHHKLKVEPLVNKLEDMVKCLKHPLKRIEVERNEVVGTNHGPDYLEVQLRLSW